MKRGKCHHFIFLRLLGAGMMTHLNVPWTFNSVSVQQIYEIFILFFSVSVGFEYETCPSLILWEKRTALLQGFELDPSNLGGWSLDKHHVLNVKSGKWVSSTLFPGYMEFWLWTFLIYSIFALWKMQFLHSFCFIFSLVRNGTCFNCRKISV